MEIYVLATSVDEKRHFLEFYRRHFIMFSVFYFRRKKVEKRKDKVISVERNFRGIIGDADGILIPITFNTTIFIF